MYKRKHGISLIVLVITILVMLILAGVVIVTMSENNPIKKAKQASFLGDAKAFAEELGVYVANSLADNSSLSVQEIDAETFADMQKVIPSFAKKYTGKFVVVNGKLVYAGTDAEELSWLQSTGIVAKKGVANAPVLDAGMVPVKFANGKWVICAEEDPSWYNYAEKMWANVMLLDGKYKEKNMVGQEVLQEDLGSMFVWIPRYAYSISAYKVNKNGTEGTTQNITEVTFLEGVTNKDIDGKEYPKDYVTDSLQEGEKTPSIVHPAFTLGGKELSGLWVGKYETSMQETLADAATQSNSSMHTPKVLPDKKAWTYIDAGNAFASSKKIQESPAYGITNADAHLVKNTEWGAICYLAASSFGVVPSTKAEGEEGTYLANTKRSTTGNETGIFDMNGGAWEIVAGFFANGNNFLSTYGGNCFAANTLKKEYANYYNVYDVSKKEKDLSNDDAFFYQEEEANSVRMEITDARYDLLKEKKGDAMYEVTKRGKYSYFAKKQGTYRWLIGPSLVDEMLAPGIYNSDMALIGHTILPFIYRGGNKVQKTSAGIFAYYNDRGYPFGDGGFRICITNK